jgi:hypothetical protein
MGKSKNQSVNYTFADRYQQFVSKLTQFAIKSKSSKDVDTSPEGIFDGEPGDLLVKNENLIFYRNQTDSDFNSLSDQFPELTARTSYVLAQGVNKNASWVKTAAGPTTWKLLGYYCPILGVNCCAVNPASGSISGSV